MYYPLLCVYACKHKNNVSVITCYIPAKSFVLLWTLQEEDYYIVHMYTYYNDNTIIMIQ